MTEAAFPDALPALTRLHWYVLERVLGQGGFGITYLAKDTNLDQRVAIKEYLPVEGATRLPDGTVRWRTDEQRDRYRWGLERFIQEARTLARFDHPNIVRVLSVFEFNGTAYMVMRFEEGGTLSTLLDRRGTLPEKELLRLILPILDGLELVHNAGFIHRDIKPDNIHIGGDGRPVLLDFGSARQSMGSSNTLTILIAPGYAPFEQYYSDPSSQGPWTDIYGLGATCYRVICGRPPLDAVSRSKGILGSTQDTLVPASVVGAGRYSGGVLAAIDHALAFTEKERPQTIAEWRKELASDAAAHKPAPAAPAPVVREPTAPPAATILDTKGSVARTPRAPPVTPPPPPTELATPMTPVGAPSRSGGVWKWALAAAVIVVVAIGAYWMGRGSDDTSSKIAALEKQLKADQDAADADRLRREKQQAEADARQRKAEEEAAQRKAQEQARAANEKARADAARASAPPPQATKRPEPPAKAATTAKSLPAPSPAAATPVSSQKAPAAKAASPSTPARSVATAAPPQEPPAQAPAVATAAPAAAPEAAKRPPTADQIADADRAMREQRYTDAVALLRPLAEAGSAQAQERLGDAYAEGRGVARNPGVAEQWYEKSGLQGVVNAQLKLGSMFASGTGVARNNNFAYVWYGTAAGLGSSAGRTERDKVGALLQPAERDQADKVIASMLAGMKKP